MPLLFVLFIIFSITFEVSEQVYYNLNIPRYVDSSETAESWDIYASMFGGVPDSEIDTMASYWTAFPNLRKDLFKPVSAGYSEIITDNAKEIIQNHTDITDFRNLYHAQFNDFEMFLVRELLDKMSEITASQEESILSENIFRRLKSLSLINVINFCKIKWLIIAVILTIEMYFYSFVYQ